MYVVYTLQRESLWLNGVLRKTGAAYRRLHRSWGKHVRYFLCISLATLPNTRFKVTNGPLLHSYSSRKVYCKFGLGSHTFYKRALSDFANLLCLELTSYCCKSRGSLLNFAIMYICYLFRCVLYVILSLKYTSISLYLHREKLSLCSKRFPLKNKDITKFGI
jgi:hypothetical protein